MSDETPLEESAGWRLESWRFDRFRALGVEPARAAILAAGGDVDWHLVERLVRSGCAPDLATKIA